MSVLVLLVFSTTLVFSPIRESAASESDSYGIVTYNVQFLRHASENETEYARRQRAVVQTLAQAEADVLCLQEVWVPDDIDNIVQKTRDTFPYHHRITVPGPDPTRVPCEPGPASEFSTCAAARCSSARSDAELLACAYLLCNTEINNMGQECVLCLLLNNHLGLTVSLGFCLQPGRYSPTHGLLMLSKRHLSDKKEFSFSANETLLLTRGYISAMIEGVGHVFCTHLTTRLAGTPVYFGSSQFSNYTQEQLHQVNLLLTAADSAAKASDYGVVVAGDMNHGPEIGDRIQGDFVDVYNAVLHRGYADPYVADMSEARCTLCRANPLALASIEAFDGSPNGTHEGNIVDHVYVPSNDVSRVVGAQRIWDEPVVFEGHSLYLSDHYGVQLEYVPPVVDVNDAIDEWRSSFSEWKQKFGDWQEDEC